MMRLYTFVLFIIGLLLIVNAPKANEVDEMEQRIADEFNTRYKNSPLNPDIKKIHVLYREVDRNMPVYMESWCARERNEITIYFDAALVTTYLEVSKHVVASTLAHEIGHCYTYSDNHQQREFLADEYGLKLYKESGGTKSEFIQRFIDRDQAASSTHPSDATRIKHLGSTE